MHPSHPGALTVVGQARGEGRAIVEGELLAALREFQGLLEGAQLLPQLQDLSCGRRCGGGGWRLLWSSILRRGGERSPRRLLCSIVAFNQSINQSITERETHHLLGLGKVVAGLHLHPPFCCMNGWIGQCLEGWISNLVNN